MRDYETAYKQSIANPEKFWGDVAKELHWFSPWKKVLEWNYPWAKWLWEVPAILPTIALIAMSKPGEKTKWPSSGSEKKARNES
ncbi:MAG: acetyl-coenzyme A synthetase N-terminal domain-containing protein [Nitrospirales bacterium]